MRVYFLWRRETSTEWKHGRYHVTYTDDNYELNFNLQSIRLIAFLGFRISFVALLSSAAICRFPPSDVTEGVNFPRRIF